MAVVWAEHDGNRIEQMLGVMLCREHPHANRVRPSRGDGGIDVMVPVGDGRYDVYQVKGFTRSLTAGQKGQVKRSLDRVAGNERITVRDWYLAVPLNPTQEGLDWFSELTEPYDFDCHWFGLDQCDGLAAKYPEVVRYYLGDGEHRLRQAISDMRQMARLTDPVEGEQVLVPTDLHGPVTAAMDAINAEDPHFRWEVQVGRYAPFEADPAKPPVFPVPPDGLPVVTVASYQVSDTAWVTWFIYPKYAGALQDHPLRTTFTVAADEDGIVDPQAADWAQYGTGGDFDVDLLDVDLPGGLGTTSSTVGRLRVFPDPVTADGEDGTYDLRIAATTSNGTLLAEAPFHMQPMTVGVGPQAGSRAHGTGYGGVATVELRCHGDGTCSITLGRNPMTGMEPAAILDDVRLLHALGAPGVEVRVGPRYGPLANSGLPLPEGANIVNRDLLNLIEALAAIQQQLCADLRMPDLEGPAITEDAVRTALTAHALLDQRGVLTPYTEQPINVHPDERDTITEPGDPVRVETIGTWQADAFGYEFEIADVAIVLAAAIVGPGDDDTTVIARPANGDNRMWLWKSLDGVLPHHRDDTAAPVED